MQEKNVQYNQDGSAQNLVAIDGVKNQKDIKELAAKLKEYEQTVNTKGAYRPIGSLYGFTISIKTEASMRDGFEFKDNRFFVHSENNILQ